MAYEKFKEYLRREYRGPYLATDIVIRYTNGEKQGIVLIERKNPPFGIALPGGIAERIPLYENALKEAKEETGLTIELDAPEFPLCVLSELEQDPREFIASVTYTAKGYGNLKPNPNEDAKRAFLCEESKLENLLEKNIWAFPHHRKILKFYLERRQSEKSK
ncbi:MAG: NUDIX domain-containing protein [archaeon]